MPVTAVFLILERPGSAKNEVKNLTIRDTHNPGSTMVVTSTQGRLDT